MGSARCEKRPRSTSSRGGGRVDADALRDYDDCHLGEKCIFDHSCTRKHRPNSDRGGGGGRGGVNSSSNGRGGEGGGTTGGGRSKDGPAKPGGGASAPGSSGVARIAATGSSTSSVGPGIG